MFSFSSIDQYHSSLQDGTATCLQAVEHYLQRINAQMHLNAFVDIYADEARTRAAALDLQRQSGRPMEVLHGVVIGIKDVIAYNGHKLTAASRILEGFHSIYSATAVERLLEAGAIIIGSLNCDEFAMGRPTKTRRTARC